MASITKEMQFPRQSPFQNVFLTSELASHNSIFALLQQTCHKKTVLGFLSTAPWCILVYLILKLAVSVPEHSLWLQSRPLQQTGFCTYTNKSTCKPVCLAGDMIGFSQLVMLMRQEGIGKTEDRWSSHAALCNQARITHTQQSTR